MELFADMEVPTEMIPFLALMWAVALVWQLLSGEAFLGLPGSGIGRKDQPEFYWTLMLLQAAAVGWLCWKYVYPAIPGWF